MKPRALSAFFCALVLFSSARGLDKSREQLIHNSITTPQAQTRIGEKIEICGFVSSTNYASHLQGKPTFLNLENPYPLSFADDPLTIIIWGDSRERFAEPENDYRNKWICVSGAMELAEGVPQLEVRNPGQIAIIPEGVECDVPVQEKLELSPREKCWLEIYKNRCNPEDVCLIRCLARGKGRAIGGGCWHLCYAYTGFDFTEPEGYDACASEPIGK